MDEFYSYLLEWGSMGLFAGYLVWSSLQQKKSEVERVQSFQEQLDKILEDYKSEVKEIRKESKAETDKIRSKYEDVLRTYQDERTAVRQNISARVREVNQTVVNLDGEVKGLMINSENILANLREMAQRQELKDLAKAAHASQIISSKEKK